MRHPKLRGVALLMLGIGAGCGNSNDSAPSDREATSSEVAEYQQLVANVQSAASSYQRAMAGSGVTTVADCERLHDRYDTQARPWVSRMNEMGGAMDHYLADHGGADVTDYGCVAATMMSELDRHRAVACASADLSADRADVARHVDAMRAYAEHLRERCDSLLRSSGSSYGPMMDGCRGWDGTCTGMMHRDCSSGMMHGGCCD